MKGDLKVVLGLIKEEFASIKPKPQGKPVLLVDGGKFMEETKDAKEIFTIVVRGEVGRDSINIPPPLLPLLEEFHHQTYLMGYLLYETYNIRLISCQELVSTGGRTN